MTKIGKLERLFLDIMGDTIKYNDNQDDTLTELDDEIHFNNLIVWDHDTDGDRMNTENLMEWLRMYYKVEKKEFHEAPDLDRGY